MEASLYKMHENASDITKELQKKWAFLGYMEKFTRTPKI